LLYVYIVAASGSSDGVYKYNSSGQLTQHWGSPGSGSGQFEEPEGIALDGEGYVLVADRETHRIQVFNLDGEFAFEWGQWGTGPGEFGGPSGVAIGPTGLIYVCEQNDRIQIFSYSTSLIRAGTWRQIKAEFAD
jgi:DNA-binding beta-propeller fold protein YncE